MADILHMQRAMKLSVLTSARALSGALVLAVASCTLGCAAQSGDEGATTPTISNEEALNSPITNFRVVRSGIYRGARPEDVGVDYLNSIGVKTILDLETTTLFEASGADIDHEQQYATSLGINWIHKPMSSFLPVDDGNMTDVQAILADSTNYPIFIHCRHGQDRTGLSIGLERVLTEKWDAQKAHDEMIADGFHMEFIQMEHYFEEKTGFED